MSGVHPSWVVWGKSMGKGKRMSVNKAEGSEKKYVVWFVKRDGFTRMLTVGELLEKVFHASDGERDFFTAWAEGSKTPRLLSDTLTSFTLYTLHRITDPNAQRSFAFYAEEGLAEEAAWNALVASPLTGFSVLLDGCRRQIKSSNAGLTLLEQLLDPTCGPPDADDELAVAAKEARENARRCRNLGEQILHLLDGALESAGAL